MGYYSTNFLIEKENLLGGIRAIIFDLNAEVVLLFNISILNATNRVPACSIVGAQDGIAAIEVKEASIRAANCTAPIVAEGTDTEERTIDVEAVARHGQFKR